MFDLIREHNLFTDVQDQILLLVEFDHELMEKRKQEGWAGAEVKSDAISLLVNNIHSIPVSFVFPSHLIRLTIFFCFRLHEWCSNSKNSHIIFSFTWMLLYTWILNLYLALRICRYTFLLRPKHVFDTLFRLKCMQNSLRLD